MTQATNDRKATKVVPRKEPDKTPDKAPQAAAPVPPPQPPTQGARAVASLRKKRW